MDSDSRRITIADQARQKPEILSEKLKGWEHGSSDGVPI
jgi:hypothetical protein